MQSSLFFSVVALRVAFKKPSPQLRVKLAFTWKSV